MYSDDKQKDLIRKYISKTYSPVEWEEIRQLMADPKSQTLFDVVLEEQWTGLHAEQDIEKEYLNQHLRNFYQKVAEEKSIVIENSASNNPASFFINKRNWFQYAAIWFVLMLGAGAYLFWQESRSSLPEEIAMHEMVNPDGQRSKILLPDSSVVFLGAGSKLSFPMKFAANTREVQLKGDAFFEVTKNPKKPFIIHTGEVQTQVLGTSFKIEAFEAMPITVAVATGKVRVDHIKDGRTTALAMLTPGQMLTYDQFKADKTQIDVKELLGWRNGSITFHNSTLKEITTAMERWYGIAIVYQHPEKGQEKISITLQVDMPLDKIMKILSATGHFSFHITAKEVQIK